MARTGLSLTSGFPHGVAVVIHDASLKRTGLIDRAVAGLTAAELCEIDIGSWFAERTPNPRESFRGEKLPTLAQVFELFSTTMACSTSK